MDVLITMCHLIFTNSVSGYLQFPLTPTLIMETCGSSQAPSKTKAVNRPVISNEIHY